MSWEVLAKPVIDALLGALRKAKQYHVRRDAEKAISEAIRELLMASPNLDQAEAKLAVAKAAGLIENSVFTAQRMLDAAKRARAKAPAAKKPPKKKPATKRVKRRTTSAARKRTAAKKG